MGWAGAVGPDSHTMTTHKPTLADRRPPEMS